MLLLYGNFVSGYNELATIKFNPGKRIKIAHYVGFLYLRLMSTQCHYQKINVVTQLMKYDLGEHWWSDG